ncbi:MAG: Gfo/Idh/MocA family oxidoreductase [Clostridia bacterium]|nr:Gfo/Idh/MocA family oxidoreductase [Clostridia bacterium]
MRKIKIAQIGTGANNHGSSMFETLTKLSDVFEVVGYVMPENERERLPNQMRYFENYKELTLDEVLNDPEIEAVTVEVEEQLLTKYALLAAKAGKHIQMEKPGGVSLSDFEELIDTVKKTGKIFHTGYMYRYNPFIIQLLDEIKRGEYGDIISVEAQMNCDHGSVLRSWLGEFPGGIMFYLGCHLVDLIHLIAGTPKKILPMNKVSGKENTTSEDFGFAVFDYENGISFAKVSAVEVGGYVRRQLVVSGTKKTLEIKPFEILAGYPNIMTEKTEYTQADWSDKGNHEQSQVFNRYELMLRYFAKYVRGEEENPYSPDYELETFKMIKAACGK